MEPINSFYPRGNHAAAWKFIRYFFIEDVNDHAIVHRFLQHVYNSIFKFTASPHIQCNFRNFDVSYAVDVGGK